MPLFFADIVDICLAFIGRSLLPFETVKIMAEPNWRGFAAFNGTLDGDMVPKTWKAGDVSLLD